MNKGIASRSNPKPISQEATASECALEFVSRDCKEGMHGLCHNKWEGMGFEVICACKCGHNKKQNSGSMVGRPDQSLCNVQNDPVPGAESE